MVSTNPHSRAAKDALVRLKELVNTLDGWELANEQEDVKIYTQSFEGSIIPAFRGDTVFLGHKYTPQQILAVANSPGCRKYWDDKFDVAEVKEIYNRFEALFWAKVKAPWPVYPRDMSATLLREFGEDECYIVMTSVEDEKIPLLTENVRANLLISGWKVSKTEEGVRVTYITQIDLAGYIPPSLLKAIQIQVPLCAGKVVQYAEKFGFPPHLSECTAEVKSEEFDNDNKVYESKVEGSNSQCTYTVSNVMYPNGVDVQINGDAQYEVVQKENDVSQVNISNINGAVVVEIKQK